MRTITHPISLYVEEISPDRIKATTSDFGAVTYNIRMMLLARNPFYAYSHRGPLDDNLGQEINGVCIVPVGRFLCMVVRQADGRGMIFLDLVGKAALAAEMAEKLGNVDLGERFMQVYTQITSHPEKHDWFELAIGRGKNQ